jgi:hypothetical protein
MNTFISTNYLKFQCEPLCLERSIWLLHPQPSMVDSWGDAKKSKVQH